MKKTDKKMLSNIIYIAVFLVISLVPLVFFSSRQAAIGNETKADKPELSDGVELTQNIDAYFSQNFGFRNRLVYAGNALKQTLFKTSGQSDVIIGEDGWLFYGRAIDDFLGTSILSQTELDRIGAVLEMMQEYVKRQGGDFIFVSAPNKMSVYGEYMPYYYIEEKGPGNYELLYERLALLGVNTVQLKNVLTAEKLEGVQLYHKLDSHWNNYGAAKAYEAMAGRLSEIYGADYSEYTHYSELDYSVKNNFSGDLQSMLLPGSDRKDEQVEFDVDEGFEYVNRFRSVDDLVITTKREDAAVDKAVTLFRDSFGNALYWFFANEYTSLTAKREIPYNIYQAAAESDLVAVELVERNLKNLLKYTPVIPSWNVGADYFNDMDAADNPGQAADAVLHMSTTSDGLTRLEGSCDELENYSYIYMKIDNADNPAEVQISDEAGNLPAQTGIYQLILGEGGDFTLYLTQEDADILKADTDSSEYTFIVRNGNKYIEIPINVTLQD